MDRTGLVLGLGVAALALLGGCASRGAPEPTFGFEAARADEAFERAREALLAEGFRIDRVDASAGVLTTRPKPTAGLATPWHGEQSTLGQEFDELVNATQRRARVQLGPAPEGGGTMVGKVTVEVDRIHRRGWNPSTASVTQSTFWTDPFGPDRGTPALFATPIGEDEALARRIAGRVRRSLELVPTGPEAAQGSGGAEASGGAEGGGSEGAGGSGP